MILIPSEKQTELYGTEIAPYLTDGKALVFAHGFNIHYSQIVPLTNVDIFMVAPKGPGHMIRRTYTAEYGDYAVGNRIITDETKKEMKKVLNEIQDGTFAGNWLVENQVGRASFNATRRNESEHQMEKVEKELRGMMSWINNDVK